jgi:hypothetical protein
MIDDTGYFLLFLRPRRFGKSLLLSMLENYYDLARKDRFQDLFGHLLIGKNPTPLRNQYFILKWDFSCVDPSGSAKDIKRAFHDHINSCIKAFELYYQLVISKLATRFGIQQMVADQGKDFAFISSFLYYFGILTIDGETDEGKLIMRVPNLTTRGLYVERIRQMLLPDPFDRDDGVFAAEQLYAKGDMEPLCEFVEQKFFKVFHNRDYRWANELTVKTAFLTLLYNDILYIIDSEKDISRTYADLIMIIRPDMRRFKIFDVLIEFKYVSLKEAGLTGQKAKELSTEELQSIPLMQARMEEAKKQVIQYGDTLEQKYDNLRLKSYAVVSLGFERLWWMEI